MPKPQRKRRRSYSNRRNKGYRRTKKQPISLLMTAPVAHKAGLEPILGDNARMGAKKMYDETGNVWDAVLEGTEILVENFTGFGIKGPEAGKFFMQYPIMTYGEILAGIAGHKLATKFGVNKHFRKMPFIGKHVCL